MRDIESILNDYKNDKITLEDVKQELSLFSLEFIEDGVNLDLGRYARKGIPEIIYTEKKDPELIKEIVSRLMEKNNAVLLSRVLTKHLKVLRTSFKDKFELYISPSYEPYTVIVTSKKFEFPSSSLNIGVLTAGTSDIPIAEEVKAISRLMGVNVVQFNDVGIAGVHRLFSPLKEMIKKKVRVIVVIAGMEGALPTIVSSLVNVPVIGVPTSIGYGYGGKGEAALMTMLQSCSPGLVVVNIDNGINAGATASLIAKQNNVQD